MTERKKERDGMEGDLERGSGGGRAGLLLVTISSKVALTHSHQTQALTLSHTHSWQESISQSLPQDVCELST